MWEGNVFSHVCLCTGLVGGGGIPTHGLVQTSYHPQHSCGKVMFSQASVILSTGGCLTDPPGQTSPREDTPLGRHPPGKTPPRQKHPLGRHPPPSACWDTPPTQCMLGYTPPDGHYSGRYASYWNAILFTVHVDHTSVSKRAIGL